MRKLSNHVEQTQCNMLSTVLCYLHTCKLALVAFWANLPQAQRMHRPVPSATLLAPHRRQMQANPAALPQPRAPLSVPLPGRGPHGRPAHLHPKGGYLQCARAAERKHKEQHWGNRVVDGPGEAGGAWCDGRIGGMSLRCLAAITRAEGRTPRRQPGQGAAQRRRVAKSNKLMMCRARAAHRTAARVHTRPHACAEHAR